MDSFEIHSQVIEIFIRPRDEEIWLWGIVGVDPLDDQEAQEALFQANFFAFPVEGGLINAKDLCCFG
jgi:hypothetical protein